MPFPPQRPFSPAPGRGHIRADARPGGRDDWLRGRGAAPARTRDRHGPGHPGLAVSGAPNRSTCASSVSATGGKPGLAAYPCRWLPAPGRRRHLAGGRPAAYRLPGLDYPEESGEGGEPADCGQRAAHVRAVEEQPLPVHLEQCRRRDGYGRRDTEFPEQRQGRAAPLRRSAGLPGQPGQRPALGSQGGCHGGVEPGVERADAGVSHCPAGHHPGHALLDRQQPRQRAAVGTDVEQHDNAPVSVRDQGHAGMGAGFVGCIISAIPAGDSTTWP
jgi:hypothetical protein